MTTNPAFEILRKFKKVAPETEDLIMKRVRGKISNTELIEIFEKGIAGDYGKFVVADPQTLYGWVDQYNDSKHSAKNYLATGLLPIETPAWENVEWDKEANKCYTAFLNGVRHENFHHCVYDRLMVDGKIDVNGYLKHYHETGNTENNVKVAKRLALRELFTDYKSKGFHTIYFIR